MPARLAKSLWNPLISLNPAGVAKRVAGRRLGDAGSDGAYPEGTVNFLAHRRLRELVEQAPSFRGNGEPSAA